MPDFPKPMGCQDTRMSLIRFDMKVSSFSHISFRAGVVKTCTQGRCPTATDGLGIHSRPCSQWKHHAWEGSSRPDQSEQVSWKAMNARRCQSELQMHVEEKWLHSARLRSYHILSRIIKIYNAQRLCLTHDDLHLRQPHSLECWLESNWSTIGSTELGMLAC